MKKTRKKSHLTVKGRAKVIDAADGEYTGKKQKRNNFNKALRDDSIHKIECTCTEDYTCHICFLILERDRMDTLGINDTTHGRRKRMEIKN
jgi:hypothetical protein